ncbi:hypothetical protein GS451_24255 [Rhodococcus hoagii]|nr:hypothetical protein [Prescottella equi]NKV87776.1 hypothetical protein [Prescottella equi]
MTEPSARSLAEWQFGKAYAGGFRVHRSFEPVDVERPYSISWDQQWLDGTFATIEEALTSGRDQVGHARP